MKWWLSLGDLHPELLALNTAAVLYSCAFHVRPCPEVAVLLEAVIAHQALWLLARAERDQAWR